MGVSAQRQFAAFLYAILTGIIGGLLYDSVRILRALLGIARYTRAGKRLYDCRLPLIGAVQSAAGFEKHHGVRLALLAVGDLCFAGFAGLAFSVFLYHAASGCFRWFYLLGSGIGFWIYYQTVGRLVMFSSEVLVFCIKAAVRYLFWFLFAPFRLLWWLLCRLGSLVRVHMYAPFAAAIRLRSRRRYTRHVRQGLAAAIRVTLTNLS